MTAVIPRSRMKGLSDFRQASKSAATGKAAPVNGEGNVILADASFRKGATMQPLWYPRAAIYAGKGASHSWLWLVDLLDAAGWYDVSFLNERDIAAGGLRSRDLFFVGGGDTYAIAEALSCAGACELRAFLERGGIYSGSCAGAYLLLDLTGSPFEPFSGFTRVQMANVLPVVPACRCLPEKFHSPYNDVFVIHAIRDSVALQAADDGVRSEGDCIIAPLYGGPAMILSEEEQALAWYQGYTEETLFLADRELADRLVLGRAGAVRRSSGQGAVILFGPHFEHPQYLQANRVMLKTICRERARMRMAAASPPAPDDETLPSELVRKAFQGIRKDLSNARIMSAGLESQELRWMIGRKSYDPEKIRFFLETVWKRLLWMREQDFLFGTIGELQLVCDLFSQVWRCLREMGRQIEQNGETTETAERLFSHLKEATAALLALYFRTRYGSFLAKEARGALR